MANMTTSSGRGDARRSTRAAGAVLVASLVLVAGLLGVGSVGAVVPTASPSGASDGPSSTPGQTGGLPSASAPPPLDHLVLAPNPTTISATGSQIYTAEGFASNGFDLGDVTGAATFSVTLNATGLPDGTCTASTCTGPFMRGDHTVTGTDGVGVSGTATLHVALAPDAPTGVIAAAGDTVASVSWVAPVSDGGAAIVGYLVTPHDVAANADGAPYPASGTTVTVPMLTDGVSYTFTVTATNSVGRSTSAPSAAVTPQLGYLPPATATGTASTGSSTTVSTAASPPPGGTAVSVVVPAGTAGGTVSIVQAAVTDPAPSLYTFVGPQVNITAPVATADNPLIFDFQIDALALTTAGLDLATVSILRNGNVVLDCDALATGASPDPCVASRVTLLSGAADLTVRTSQASHWNFGKGGFTVSGFFRPVDNRPVVNSAKAGSAIPVKFSLGANQGLTIFTTGYPRSAQTACDSSAPVDAIEQTVTAGGSTLSYDPISNQYTYIWKTDKTWAAAPGGPCRQLVLSFVDGHILRANFKFR